MITLLFGSFFILLAFGVPIAIAIGLTVLVVLSTNDISLLVVPQRMFAGADSFPLVAIPFFILAGDIMAKGKVSEKMVQFADSLLGSAKVQRRYEDQSQGRLRTKQSTHQKYGRPRA